jgi:hypothetical protein
MIAKRTKSSIIHTRTNELLVAGHRLMEASFEVIHHPSPHYNRYLVDLLDSTIEYFYAENALVAAGERRQLDAEMEGPPLPQQTLEPREK